MSAWPRRGSTAGIVSAGARSTITAQITSSFLQCCALLCLMLRLVPLIGRRCFWPWRSGARPTMARFDFPLCGVIFVGSGRALLPSSSAGISFGFCASGFLLPDSIRSGLAPILVSPVVFSCNARSVDSARGKTIFKRSLISSSNRKAPNSPRRRFSPG